MKIEYEYDSEKIRWQQTIDEVNERFYALQACWKETEKKQPELHKKLVEELYFPALACLGHFCAAVKIS